jgi:hypothetical protein
LLTRLSGKAIASIDLFQLALTPWYAQSRCGGSAVPIRLIIKNDPAFTPEDRKVLADAFEDTLRELKLVDREDPVTRLVAEIMIELAKEGERDPARLRDLTLKSVTK